MRVRYADHEEVFEAGDVYYLPPGHVPVIEPGSQIVEFSPKDELAKTAEVVLGNMEGKPPRRSERKSGQRAL